MRGRIYPVPIKPASPINTWRDWPADVREIIHGWNHGKGLTFIRSPNVFKCFDCGAYCRTHRHGAAVFRDRRGGEWLCDDCVIARARESAASGQQRQSEGQ